MANEVADRAQNAKKRVDTIFSSMKNHIVFDSNKTLIQHLKDYNVSFLQIYILHHNSLTTGSDTKKM